MAKTENMARQAIALSEEETFDDQDEFTDLMKDNDLPFTGWTFDGGGMTAHLILFQDGSNFFADTEDAQYKLWPLDEEDEDQRQNEFLPSMKTPQDVFVGDVKSFEFHAFEKEMSETFTAHLKECISEHPDPPEATRNVILEPQHRFEWSNQDTARQAQEMIVLCAAILYPEATEITIKSDVKPGISPAEKRTKDDMCNMMQDGGYLTGTQESMSAYYAGDPHAEISEGGTDYAVMLKANEPLAWLSRRILKNEGRPVGWEVDYNDGHRTRMSGFSAYSESVIIEVAGALSNHQRVQKEHSLAHYLMEQDLLEPFQIILQEYGFQTLPAAAA